MGDSYPKASGSAGSKGVDFQIDLLSVFLLNALKNIKDWKLSTENKMAGKFDDVVLELSDGSAILLQAKHKENKKITLDQLLSTNPKNEDFSLPKYFLSYLNDVKTKFPVKLVMICTNTQADAEILKYLNRDSVCRDSMLHHEDSASLFTFNDDIVPDLIANAKVYNKNNLKQKSVDESAITEESVTEFLRHLQIHVNYPHGNGLEKVIEKLLSGLKSSEILLRNISHRDIHQKVKDWFEQPKGEYLTECRAKAMLCEIKSEKYRLLLEDYKVFFRSNNDLNFTDLQKRIYHVVAEGGYLLHLLKVYRSLQHSETKILYAGPDDGLSVQQQVIKAFELPLYTHLIIISPKLSEKFGINEISIKLRDILHTRKYKRIIFVAENSNKLAQRLKSTDIDYDTFCHSPTLEDLSEDTQQMLLKKKSIAFQGEDISLMELFSEHILDVHKESIKSGTLEKLVKDEKIKTGMKLMDLEEDISRHYIDRSFERILKVEDEFSREEDTISEEDIYHVDEKIVLISDGAGAGKTTVLKHLAITIKNNNPCLWVIRIELTDCTKILRDSLKNGKPIDVQKLLSCTDTTRLTNELETLIFSLKKRVVLMLDGVDEISPDYTSLITNLLLQSQKAENLRKVFVTARSHMERELEAHLKVRSFALIPLTKQNQIDFFVYYWTHALELDDECKSKCERYATMLVNRVSSWTVNWLDDKFSSSPLHARMLAEVFLENNGEDEWEGCKEYLNADEDEPRLPTKMNIVKLYEMFIDKKKNIFLNKGNPSGNVAANQALMDQFEECLAFHRSLALEVIIDEDACAFFSCYQRNVKYEQIKLLKMGIVQELDNKLSFVHRTFAEYFVAEMLLKELQLKNNDVKFQKFLIDEVFFYSDFDTTRRFLDNFLQKNTPSLSFEIFESYMAVVDDSNNATLIHRLAKKGNTKIIHFILQCIDFKVTLGRETTVYYGKFTPTKMNTLNILKYLVQLGGINIRDYKDRTPLHQAAYGGHLDTVKFLVEMGANVNSNDKPKGTALHYAASRGDIDMVEFLVEHIADINITNRKDCTALHYAAKSNRFNTVEFLLKHGADINMANKDGCTTLHYATKSGSFDIVKFLVKNNVDVNVVDGKGRTALHFAAVQGSLDILEFLVKNNANIKIADKDGYTALHLAAWKGSFDIVKFLAKHDVAIDVESKKCYTPLHFATWRGSFEIVDFLVKHGADIKKKAKNGYTALHCATQKDIFNNIQNMIRNYDPGNNVCYDDEARDLSISVSETSDFSLDSVECLVHNGEDINTFNTVEFLVKNGVDVDTQSNEGYVALHFAADEGSFNIVKFLVEHDANVNIRNKEGYTAIHFAARYGCFHVVEFLVKNGADINVANRKGNTVLHYAAESGSFDIVECLVKHEVDIHLANNKGYTALHLATKNSSFDIVEYLVQREVDIHIADQEGRTALHYAAQITSLNIVKLLVNNGAYINTATKQGYTALHLAAKNDSFDIVEFLVKHDADIHTATSERYTAVHFAAKSRSLEMIVLLMEYGADVHIADKEGCTALHFAAKSNSLNIVEFFVQLNGNINIATKKGDTALHLAAKHDCFHIIEFLVTNNADIQIANNKGNTALHYAAKSGNFDSVEFLVKRGVDTNITNNKGCTALHFAAKSNSVEIVNYLVKHGLDIRIADNEGCTALHYAVQTTSFEVVGFLVHHGVNINTVIKKGNTALHLAAKNANFDIAEILVRNDADIHIANKKGYTALHFAARGRSFKIVRLLLTHGIDIHTVTNEGYTALHLAAENDSFDIVESLVKHDANTNTATKEGCTALHFAARRSFDIFDLLVKHGANINIANSEGYTPLHLAAKKGKHGNVELLIKHGVDINVANNKGHTALHFAAEKGSFQVIKILVEHGVNINITNKEGCTALHFAVKSGFLEIVELLVTHGADINIANRKGKTALRFAIEEGNGDIVKFLEEKHWRGG